MFSHQHPFMRLHLPAECQPGEEDLQQDKVLKWPAVTTATCIQTLPLSVERTASL